MGRKERRRQDAARDASLLLIQDALVQIRAMAHLRRDLPSGEDEASGDYHERIRLIADVCENLPGYLRAGTGGSPVDGLRYAWDKANEVQQVWLRETLDQHGLVLTDLVT